MPVPAPIFSVAVPVVAPPVKPLPATTAVISPATFPKLESPLEPSTPKVPEAAVIDKVLVAVEVTFKLPEELVPEVPPIVEKK